MYWESVCVLLVCFWLFHKYASTYCGRFRKYLGITINKSLRWSTQISSGWFIEEQPQNPTPESVYYQWCICHTTEWTINQAVWYAPIHFGKNNRIFLYSFHSIQNYVSECRFHAGTRSPFCSISPLRINSYGDSTVLHLTPILTIRERVVVNFLTVSLKWTYFPEFLLLILTAWLRHPFLTVIWTTVNRKSMEIQNNAKNTIERALSHHTT